MINDVYSELQNVTVRYLRNDHSVLIFKSVQYIAYIYLWFTFIKFGNELYIWKRLKCSSPYNHISKGHNSFKINLLALIFEFVQDVDNIHLWCKCYKLLARMIYLRVLTMKFLIWLMFSRGIKNEMKINFEIILESIFFSCVTRFSENTKQSVFQIFNKWTF